MLPADEALCMDDEADGGTDALEDMSGVSLPGAEASRPLPTAGASRPLPRSLLPTASTCSIVVKVTDLLVRVPNVGGEPY